MASIIAFNGSRIYFLQNCPNRIQVRTFFLRLHILSAILMLISLQALRSQEARFATYSTGRPCSDTIALRGSDSIHLSHQFIQSGSVHCSIDGIALHDTASMKIDCRYGVIVLDSAFRTGLDTNRKHVLIVSYRALPFTFPDVYRNRTLITEIDTIRRDTLHISVPTTPLTVESIFGPDLQKSGYIGRGFTVGTNRDMGLNSGFRLQLSGKLSQDIAISAALTDENTPIQPEGNTKTLQELDKVFIRVTAPHVGATLGDFNLALNGTEFARYNRKLSGVLVDGTVDPGIASVSYATMKGTYYTNQFNGTDGVQGPYRLSGKSGEQRIVVIAGTEKVYVDGVPMVRGETNDYIIDYSAGEITFKPRRLITSYSRITVDFEYSDRSYQRTMFAASGTGRLFDDRVSLTARYIREADDQDSPIDIELSDEDRNVLAQAGDDQKKTWRSGVSYAGIDSLTGKGAGQYMRVDTLIGGVSLAIYRYAAGEDSATWSVQFSFVGDGQGDYVRKSMGTYQFSGINAGSYGPVRILPLPRLQQNMTMLVESKPVRGLELSCETGFSVLDKNRFSTLDDADNSGLAFKARSQWTSNETPIGGLTLGANVRQISSRFTSIDRMDDIEFARKWDITNSSASDETMVEASAGWKPVSMISTQFGYGSLVKGDFSSQRLSGDFALAPQQDSTWMPALSYSIESIASYDGAYSHSTWLRQRGEGSLGSGFLRPHLKYEQEYKRAWGGDRDSLQAGSLAFVDLRPGFETREIWNMRFSADVGYRREEAVLDGRLQKQSDDIIQQYGWSLRSWNNLSAGASVTVRDRKYTEAFRMTGQQDLQTILTKLQTQYAPLKRAVNLDLLYEVSTERSAKLERVYWKVPVGQGSYIYKGDLNANGVQDENEFEPTRFDGDYVLLTVPTDELYPVIDLRSSARLELNPSRILPRNSHSILMDALNTLSSETSVRVEEKSSDPKTSNIYFLRMGTFMNDSTTIRGFTSFRQDLFVFDQRPDFSLRFRFDERRSFTQYSAANERGYKREQSVRLRTQLVREIGIQADAALIRDDVACTQYSNRARAIDGTTFAVDFSYRPYPRVEAGLVVNIKNASDNQQTGKLDADINSQVLRTTITFDGPGRLRLEFERDEVVFNKAADQFPFELTDGKAEGKSWVWRLNFDYRIAGFIQSTVSYLGRSESGNVLHTVRAEVKAYF
jgi:hypothetical protein